MMEAFLLSNGVKVPAIGMGTGWMNVAYKRPRYLARRVLGEIKQRVRGTYSSETNYTASYELRKLLCFKRSITQSLKIGYSLYDTAYSYNNCELMGQAFRFPRDRDGVFLVSKCSNYAQRTGTVRDEFLCTLEALGTDFIDLYLLHWTQTGTYVDAWRVLEDLYAEGKAKAIGVSNFHVHHIEELRDTCSILPMVDEVECHPLLQQKALRDYCTANQIQLIAHTPTGKMRSNVTESTLKSIASSHGKTIAQVILRWHYQLGDISVCNTLNPSHMAENLNVFDFCLSEVEMEMIGRMDASFRIWPDPDNCDFMAL